MTSKVLIVANGAFPQQLPDPYEYDFVICTDGAYHNYVKNPSLPCHYIIGDLDSLNETYVPSTTEIIYTPDQNKTDFEKALLFTINKGITDIDVYGASGKEHDHFLGNLSVALQLKEQAKIVFYDDYQMFFFADKQTELIDVKDKKISLLPFFIAHHVQSTGLLYPIENMTMIMGHQIGVRNTAIDDTVTINFTQGDLLIFVNHHP